MASVDLVYPTNMINRPEIMLLLPRFRAKVPHSEVFVTFTKYEWKLSSVWVLDYENEYDYDYLSMSMSMSMNMGMSISISICISISTSSSIIVE